MVVVTDVVGSTKAIEAGRHKEVNLTSVRDKAMNKEY